MSMFAFYSDLLVKKFFKRGFQARKQTKISVFWRFMCFQRHSCVIHILLVY